MGERIRRIESHQARAGDPNLFLRGWHPEHPRRAVVLVHGFGEHSGRYDEFGSWLAESGCAVQGYDHRGHGRSGGEVGHVDRFEDYLNDLDSVLSDTHAAYPNLPLHLLGHSMGGLICAAYLAERTAPLVTAVLSAPALAADAEPRHRVAGGRLLRMLRPRHRIASPVDPDALSTDPAVVQAYLDDPFVRHDRMTVSLALELLAGMSLAVPEKIHTPTLVLHGDDDRICAPAISEAFAGGLPQGKQVRYPGLRHEILNEPSRAEVYREILRWLETGEAQSR